MVTEKEIKIISPKQETLKIFGEMSYSEGRRAWNLLRFKQNLLNEFPQLKQRRNDFAYQMIMHRNYEDLEKAIKKMKKENSPIPIFLWLGQKKGGSN